ncbi:helix-turn-helix transcriptional regulator [Lentzea sp. NBRC 105346]|uniref:AAA family ATPase n=1 Tax=Lentzea sp. NBRC 105346 TaxID=3032205 RepID=UPI0024A29D09|nr:LuxR C-terminal-related transcriptional regulator [Lentzea sp. NBRC 105346]GLZ31013.1 helix-turn-helix transcriptional regulator [Lentzea sp. NBRC 105346]
MPRDDESPAVPPKSRVPSSAVPLVRRERLLSTLEECVTSSPPPVTVVTGPAGAGKTTLLADWARASGKRVAWVTVDEHDNRPPHLWSAVRDALVLSEAWPDRGVLDAVPLREPGFASAIIAAFEQVTTPVCLVLDNAHELREGDVLVSLDLLVRHTPDQLRLVLAFRYPPPLHLSRLRVEGRLREVGAEQLAFRQPEAEELFANHLVRVTPDEVAGLLRDTEGWTGGLRLAAMALKDGGSAAALPMFDGEDERVADYLVEEVLSQHPEHVRDFLVATSVCDSLSADLAGAVAGCEDAGAVLDLLDRTNSLVTKMDSRERYRYHPVLRGFLSAELRRTRPADRERLHLAAARWYAGRDEPIAALEHAISASDGELIGELIEQSGLREILLQGGERLHELLTTVPQHLLGRPVVGLVAALAALDAGDPAAADRVLDQVGRSAHPLRSDHLRALHATVLVHRARFDGNHAEPLKIMSRTPAGSTGQPELDGIALLNRGVAALWRGEHRQAEADLTRAFELARTEGYDHAVLQCQVHLAALAIASGDVASTVSRAQSAVSFAEEKGWESEPVCGLAYALLGTHAYQRLADAEARQLAARAVSTLTRRSDPTVELSASILDTVVSFEHTADPHAVAADLWRKWRELDGIEVAPPLVAYVAPAAQRMALRVGEQQWAAGIADQLESMLGPCGEHALLQAVLHTHHARTSQARKAIAPVLSGELRPVVATTAVDAWLLEATLVDRAGSPQQAHQAVSKALALAEPIDAIRPFHNAGKPIRDLLASGAGRFGRLDPFATTTMTALPPVAADSVDVLTSRERDLLVELPSMRTAEEIADAMFVSVNTVKTHLRGIYRKLGVNQRRDAVIVARQRGLI